MPLFDTRHEDMIHDVQLNYYGKQMATCSSDRTIKIFDLGPEGSATQTAELKGHEGPVWQVSWAHPKFGNILASCGYDRKVIIWRETNNTWQVIFEYNGHELSVNSVSWAPHEHGLILACASSDGSISILNNRAGGFDEERIPDAHGIGVNAVSWAPYECLVTGVPVKRLVSGGCDGAVKIWSFIDNKWQASQTLTPLNENSDWIRDVAWAPNIGLPTATIASCSQDGTVTIWTQQNGAWKSKKLPLSEKSPEVIWRVSWSITGNILAVSGGDNRVTLWKEAAEGDWVMISALGENGLLQQQN